VGSSGRLGKKSGEAIVATIRIQREAHTSQEKSDHREGLSYQYKWTIKTNSNTPDRREKSELHEN